ncbi:hypothetical protein F4859DRAFT_517829 [Xylaria cf. heliscus]|nr:hypothetical protein F4859DRAFT_517829 [Xylaria cf. heliscus]
MDSNNRFNGAPASPWAERYGLPDKYHIDLVKEDPLVHSQLAPLLPNLHPRYYDKLPPEEEFEIANTFHELDSIFVTEDCQRVYLHGLVSWHLPALNSTLSWDGCPPLPGGHRMDDNHRYYDLLKQYHAERIEVDENSWLPFFRKDRWYNLHNMGKEDRIEEADGSTWNVTMWSVDDERIWSHVRFVIEIANRILLAMIRDNNRWLEMVLYGRIQLWYELFSNIQDPIYHKARNNDKRIIIPLADDIKESNVKKRAPPTVKPDPDPEKRIAFVNDLLQNLSWTFMPSNMSSRGSTFVLKVNRTIFQVVYELMHAIYKNRIDTRNNISDGVLKELNDTTLPGMYRAREVFVNYEPIGELGRSLEANVFGGTPFDRPGLEVYTSRRITANVAMVKYPSKMGVSGAGTLVDPRGFPSMEGTAVITSYFLPAALLWRLQSKAFWDGPVDGEKGFMFPQLFTGNMQQELRSRRYTYGNIDVKHDAAADISFSDVINRWNEQGRIWSERRPWYREEYDTWRRTVWGYTSDRMAIEMFIEGFKERDEAICASAAWTLQGLLPNRNVKNLPGDDESILPKLGTTDGGPQMWLLHCLGTIMLAALPMRNEDQDAVATRFYFQLLRSSGMLPQFKPVTHADQTQGTRKIQKRNVFFTRMSDQGEVRGFKRMDLVDHAVQLLFYVGKERASFIPRGWFNAIVDLAYYMKREMVFNGNFIEEDWVPSFPFETPPYDPDSFVRWNPSSSEWEAVMPYQPPDSPSQVLNIADLSLT